MLNALAAGSGVYVLRAARRVRERLETLGLLQRLAGERVFETRDQAMQSAVQRITSPNTSARHTISSPS